MPEHDANFGSALNSETARVIERKCDFLDMPQEMQISELEGDAWNEGHGTIAVYQVLTFNFNTWNTCRQFTLS